MKMKFNNRRGVHCTSDVGFGLDRTEKGITLIALVITIIVLLILAGVALSLVIGDTGITERAIKSRGTYNIASIEEKANLAYSDILVGGYFQDGTHHDIDLESVLTKLKTDKDIDDFGITSAPVIGITLDKDNISLSKGGTDTINVTLNRDTSGGGDYYIEVEGQKYIAHMQNDKIIIDKEPTDIDGGNGGTNDEITASSSNTTSVGTSVSENTVTVTATQTVGNATITISYGAFSETCSVAVVVSPTAQSEADGNVTFATNYGTIDVIWLDTSNNVISAPNDPTSHLAGMTKVAWNENADHSVSGDEFVPDSNWYSYTAGTGTSDNRSSRWANAKLGDSYFVWIPRYAYRITYYSSQANSSDPANATGYYDGWGQWRASDGSVRLALDPGVETVTYDGNKYIVHPAFTNDNDTVGTKLPYDLGGWDSELAGFWVSKYEMSRSDATDSSEGSGTTFVSKPGVQSARNIKIGDIYTYSLAFDNAKSSHMMKNSEWGAVAYLTQSQYGRNGNEININNSISYITGNGGGSTSASSASGTTNAYNSANGTKASSTGNVYGIYDLSGSAWEYVASYNKASNTSYISINGSSFAISGGASTKYATAYSNGTSSDQGNSILMNCGKIGDSTKEVNTGGAQDVSDTSSYYNWFSDYSKFVILDYPFFSRGCHCQNGGKSGIFGSSFFRGDGYSYSSFRTILCP